MVEEVKRPRVNINRGIDLRDILNDEENVILEEIKKEDPLIYKHFKIFHLISQLTAANLIKFINKYDEERQMRLMELITRMGEEIAKSKAPKEEVSNIRKQYEDIKYIITDLAFTISNVKKPKVVLK
jgi:hypothetical protein